MMSSFFIFLNKPAGFSSHSFIKKFQKKWGYKKIGHNGTLDPFASGLLLVGVNEATKYFSYIEDKHKTYEATVCLGRETDTLDVTGEVIAEQPVPELNVEQVIQKTLPLLGDIEQQVPEYSAVKIQGQRAYRLARSGEVVTMPKRRVTVFSLEVLSWQSPELKIRVTVSRGTYIRMLAKQIAACLGSVGHLTSLCRVALCGNSIEQAVDLTSEDISKAQKPIVELLKNYPDLLIDNRDQALALLNGKRFDIKDHKEGVCVAQYAGQFLGLVEILENSVSAKRMMNTQEIHV